MLIKRFLTVDSATFIASYLSLTGRLLMLVASKIANVINSLSESFPDSSK